MAVQGFNYTLNWSSDFNDVDSAPAGFTDRSARTKATVTLDPKMTAKRDAGTTDYYFAPDSVIVIVKAVKVESWVVSDKKSDKLLKHEQLHYNISALAARDLERKILALRNPSGKELIKQKETLGAETQTLITQINKDYDNDLHGTSHGQKDTEQAKWELHITNLMGKSDGELKSL